VALFFRVSPSILSNYTSSLNLSNENYREYVEIFFGRGGSSLICDDPIIVSIVVFMGSVEPMIKIATATMREYLREILSEI